MQNTNCTISTGQRISVASFIADKCPSKHFVCVPFSYLPGKIIFIYKVFCTFKSTFMISMMNDEDLTDSTQKRLQWDAEERG